MALTEAEQRELEELEYEQLLAEQAAATSAPPQAEAPPQETPAWRQLLSGVSRALDYPGGLARLGAAGIANIPYSMATGDSITETGDLKRALLGEGPTSEEFMRRAGVGTGDVVEYPVIGPVSTRELGGFALDVATDPLTALSKAGKFGANALDRASVAGGKKLYKSGLKNVDEAIAGTGSKPFSDVMLERGVTGSNKKIQAEAEKMLSEASTQRQALYQTADDAGVLVNPRDALGPVLEETIAMGNRDPGLKELSEKLAEKIAGYIEYGPVPLSQASEWKTNLYNALPDTAFDRFGKLKGPAQKIEKKVANAFKDEIVKSGDAAIPGLGSSVAKNNEVMESILNARKPLRKAVKSEANKNAFTAVDAGILGTVGAFTQDPIKTATALGIKKAGDISKTTGFRTRAGKRLIDLGETNMLTPMINRTVLQSPWVKMTPRKDENGK